MSKKSQLRLNKYYPASFGISVSVMIVFLFAIFLIVNDNQKNLLHSNASIQKALPYCASSSAPSVTMDPTYDGYFSNLLGPGWIAGDASYSTRLPNGSESWVFSDTIIGTASTNSTATMTGMPRNTELVGTGGKLTGDYTGTYTAPQTVIPDTSGNWEVAGTYIENNKQLIFVNEFGTVAGSPFENFTGRAGIAVMSLSTKMPSYSSVVNLPTDPTTQWGNAVASDTTYNYIYGNDTDTSNGTFYGMKLARVPKGYTTQVNKWQYWNGSTWASGESHAVPLNTGNELTGVTKQLSNTGYMAVSIQNNVFTDNTLYISYACSPQGPWSTPVSVYTIPEVTQYKDEIAYIPTFHPELSTTTSGLLVSYNVDTTDGLGALMQNIHQYQPRFLRIK